MKILILGGGISGVSAAWYLRKRYREAKIMLLEKEDRLGGVMQTSHPSGFLFEQGPRTFQTGRSPHLFELICALGLESELLFSPSSTRYLWQKGHLHSLASFFPTILFALFRSCLIRRQNEKDESIYDFSNRRFGNKFTQTLMDPLTLGIYAGDIHGLSIRSCFPTLYSAFKKNHSKNSSNNKLNHPTHYWAKPKGLFTLRHGMSQLINALATKSAIEISLNTNVESIQQNGVFANGHFFPADQIFSALPLPVIGKLSQFWRNVETTNLQVVHLAYAGNVLSKKGFGYLIPTKEKQDILGMIWDSSIFPEQNTNEETRLTAMVRKGGIETALNAARNHLDIQTSPVCTHISHAVLPQFTVGYENRLIAFQQAMLGQFPTLTLLGNYLGGISVEHCIAYSKLICMN